MSDLGSAKKELLKTTNSLTTDNIAFNTLYSQYKDDMSTLDLALAGTISAPLMVDTLKTAITSTSISALTDLSLNLQGFIVNMPKETPPTMTIAECLNIISSIEKSEAMITALPDALLSVIYYNKAVYEAGEATLETKVNVPSAVTNSIKATKTADIKTALNTAVSGISNTILDPIMEYKDYLSSMGVDEIMKKMNETEKFLMEKNGANQPSRLFSGNGVLNSILYKKQFCMTDEGKLDFTLLTDDHEKSNLLTRIEKIIIKLFYS
jgi:hypothetical protein